jgi:YfiR/HmsC-like
MMVVLPRHLVFIATSEQRQLPAILRELEGRGVLTVGDTPGFAESGVVLNLVMKDQRVLLAVRNRRERKNHLVTACRGQP